MAYFHISTFMLLLLVLWLFFFNFVVTIFAVSNSLVDGLCNDTQNPEFCKTTLKNYPRTKSANMDELGIITILLATAQARVNKYVVDELLHGDDHQGDDVTKKYLSNCLIDYEVAMGKLKSAYRLSYKKDYKGMTNSVKDAKKMTNKCEDGFKRNPSRPSPLTDYNQKMAWLNDIALVTLYLLDV